MDVNWQFAVQMPVGGTQECAALFVAFVQAWLLAHQETSSASALLRALGKPGGLSPSGGQLSERTLGKRNSDFPLLLFKACF